MIKKVESSLDIAYIIKCECKILRNKGAMMYNINIDQFRRMSITEVANMIINGSLYYEPLELMNI